MPPMRSAAGSPVNSMMSAMGLTEDNNRYFNEEAEARRVSRELERGQGWRDSARESSRTTMAQNPSREQTITDFNEFPPEIANQMRQQRYDSSRKANKGKPKAERRQAKAVRRRGIYETQGEDGKNYRYDKYGEAMKDGFRPIRTLPTWMNNVRQVMGEVLNPGGNEPTAQRNLQYAKMGQEGEFHQDSVDSSRLSQQLGMENQAVQDFSQAHARDLQASAQADTLENRQQLAEKTMEFRLEMEKIRRDGNQGKQLNPFEQAAYDWERKFERDDPIMYDAWQKMQHGYDPSNGQWTGQSGSRRKGSPALTDEDIIRNEMSLQALIDEMTHNIGKLEGEISGDGFLNLGEWAGLDPVDIKSGKDTFNIRGQDIKSTVERYKRNREAMESMLTNMRKLRDQGGAPPAGPEDWFGDMYNSPGQGPQGYAPTGVQRQTPQTGFNSPPAPPTPQGVDPWRGPTEMGPDMGEGPSESPYMTSGASIPEGTGPNERMRIPSDAELAAGNFSPRLFSVLKILRENPGMSNQAASQAAMYFESLGPALHQMPPSPGGLSPNQPSRMRQPPEPQPQQQQRR